MMKLLLTILCAVLLFSSCERNCVSMEARIVLVGFPANEITQIQLKRFSKGSGVNGMADSVLFNAANCNCYLSNDTFEISPFINNLPGLRSGFDYELVLPATGRSYRITEVTENYLSEKAFSARKAACMNTLSSYKVNNILFSAANLPAAIVLNR